MIQASALESSFQTTFSNGEHSSVADLPIAKGGAGHGFGPHDLLEAALATCMVMTVQIYAQEHQFPLTSVHCEVRIDRPAIDSGTLAYDLSIEGNLTPEQAEQLRTAAARCPVARTLVGSIALQPLS